MDGLVDYREPSVLDYVHLVLVCLGVLLALGGTLIISVPTAICGLVLVAVGLTYFLLNL